MILSPKVGLGSSLSLYNPVWSLESGFLPCTMRHRPFTISHCVCVSVCVLHGRSTALRNQDKYIVDHSRSASGLTAKFRFGGRRITPTHGSILESDWSTTARHRTIDRLCRNVNANSKGLVWRILHTLGLNGNITERTEDSVSICDVW